MEDIIIRTLTEEDVYGAAEVRINGWKVAYKNIIDDDYLNSLSILNQVKKFNECVGNDNFIVAVLNNKVLGFCRFVYDNFFSDNLSYVDCELTAIYVHPDYKGKGIGTKMFNYVIDKFKSNNKSTMILWCLADNNNSINFYKHMGGEIKESKITQIGDKDYEEVGIIYDLKKV